MAKRPKQQWPQGTDNLGTEPNPVPPRPPPRRGTRKKVEVPEQVITSAPTSPSSGGGSGWVWLLVLLAAAKWR